MKAATIWMIDAVTWLLFVLSLVAGAYGVWHCCRRALSRLASAPAQQSRNLTGVRGWLLVFIAMLWSQVILTLRYAASQDLTRWRAQVAMLGMAVLGGIAAYLLGRRKSLGIRLAKLSLFGAVVMGSLRLFLYIAKGRAVADLYGGIEIVVGALGWWLYLSYSKRVQKTYLLNERNSSPPESA